MVNFWWINDRSGVPVKVSRRVFERHWIFYKLNFDCLINLHRYEDGCTNVSLYHEGKQVMYFIGRREG